MRLVGLLERNREGWRAWIPELPGCEATGATQADAEEALRQAGLERIHGLKTPAERAGLGRLRAIELSLRVRIPDVEPQLSGFDAAARGDLVQHLDALLDSGRLPRELLNAAFSFRRDLVDSSPEPIAEVPAPSDPGPNLLHFGARRPWYLDREGDPEDEA